MLQSAQSLRSKLGLVSEVARLGWHTARDTIGRPVPDKAEDIPRSIEAMTCQWLTAVLCAATPSVRVADFELGPVSAGSSVRRGIKLRYEPADAAAAAGLPATLFAKSSARFLNRLLLGLSRTVEIESMAYRHIRPQLRLEAPLCYHSAYDLRSGRQILLLEDLVATKNARFCTPRTRIDRGQAEQMMSILAELHGRFLGENDLQGTYPYLKTCRQWFEDGHERFGLRKYHDKAMQVAAQVIPSDIQARGHQIWPAQIQSLSVHDLEPKTLVHCDVHLGNWYITGEGRMGLCDWQCVSIGSWSRDFAYAVSAALTVEDRRAWDRDLLQCYLDELQRVSGRKIEFNHAWLRYRQQLPASLLMWTPTLCHSPIMPDMQPPEISLEMIKRITTAMSDLDALAAF